MATVQPILIPGLEALYEAAVPNVPAQAKPRLTAQLARVESLMLDGRARSLSQISAALRKLYPQTRFPEASVSARLRDLRRKGYKVAREDRGEGLSLYRLEKAEAAN